MAHLLTISDIKLERERLINSMAILPLSYKFTEQEKEALQIIYQDTLIHYDNAIARDLEVTFSKKTDFSATPKIITSQNQVDEIIKNDFKIILITGKPYSGKTSFAKRIAENFNEVAWICESQLNHNFTFNNISNSTDLIVFDDVEKIKSINELVYGFIYNKIILRKRGLAPFCIDTPKLIITTDSKCNIEQLSESVKRRLLIINL